MSDEPQEKPKIIIDDDWKEQVQAEKEAARKGDDQPEAEAAATDSEQVQLPPASFATLVSSFAAQALAAMGQMPGPDGKPMLQLDVAKHLIDTLGVLEEKTKGNLTPDETSMMVDVLHELRMVFVAVQQHGTGAEPD